MLLSIGMICDQLRDLNPKTDYHGYNKEMNLARSVFLTNVSVLKKDTLYIVTKETTVYLDGIRCEQGTAIVYVGSEDFPYNLSNAALVVIRGLEFNPMEISNRIWQIFEDYHQIDVALNKAVFADKGLQKIVEVATRLFDNEITIRDKNHRYVARSYRKILYSEVRGISQPDEKGYASQEELNSLQSDDKYMEEFEFPDPWFYIYEECTLLCFDIYSMGNFIYRVKVSDVKHPFRAYDTALMRYFCELVRESYLNAISHPRKGNQSLAAFWIELTSHEKPMSDVEIMRNLQKIRWDMNHVYLALCLTAGEYNGDIKAYSYYCRYIYCNYKYVFAFEFDGHVAVIVNLSLGYDSRVSNFESVFAEFLRDQNFRAGFSLPFSKIRDLPYYYRQAEAALEQGLIYDSSLWNYHFEKYQYHWLLEQIMSVFPSSEFILPELHLLYQKDLKEHTEYLKTLKFYYLCDRNLARASKKLNIHRSTLIYRLDRIRENLHVNIDDRRFIALAEIILYMGEIREDFM